MFRFKDCFLLICRCIIAREVGLYKVVYNLLKLSSLPITFISFYACLRMYFCDLSVGHSTVNITFLFSIYLSPLYVVQEADTDENQGTLTFEEFCVFYKMMSLRRDLYLLLLSYSDKKDHLTVEELAQFLKVEQKV